MRSSPLGVGVGIHSSVEEDYGYFHLVNFRKDAKGSSFANNGEICHKIDIKTIFWNQTQCAELVNLPLSPLTTSFALWSHQVPPTGRQHGAKIE